MKNPPLEPIFVNTNGALRLLSVSRGRFHEWSTAGLISPAWYNGNRPMYSRVDVLTLPDRLPRGVRPTEPLLPAEDRALVREHVGEPDFGAIYTECFDRRVPSLGANEARRRALADTIRAYRQIHDCAYKPAAVAVRALIPSTSPVPIDQRQPDAELDLLNISTHADESPPGPVELATASGWRAKV